MSCLIVDLDPNAVGWDYEILIKDDKNVKKNKQEGKTTETREQETMMGWIYDEQRMS